MEKSIRNSAEDILMELGVMPRNRAFLYCCEAVEMMFEDETITVVMICKLIASRHKKTETNVYNCMCYSIKQIPIERLKNTFGNVQNTKIANFLGMLYVKAKRNIEI